MVQGSILAIASIVVRIIGIAYRIPMINIIGDDTGILIGVSSMMLLFAYTGKKTNRVEGAISLLVYIAYTAYIIMRAFHIWIF